jgi:uncharacterized protein
MMRFHDEWLFMPQRFAVHEPSATAVLADVHLGYSAARRRQGDAVPSRSVMDEMRPLVDAARLHDFRNVIVAGDLFERGFDETIAQQFLAVLGCLDLRFLGLVPGNHDRVSDRAANFPIFTDGYDLAGWRIVHGDRPAAEKKVVMGHWHPARRWNRRKVPCFLTRQMQLILPAFSLDAAGVDVGVESPWNDWACSAIVGNRVIDMSTTSRKR